MSHQKPHCSDTELRAATLGEEDPEAVVASGDRDSKASSSLQSPAPLRSWLFAIALVENKTKQNKKIKKEKQK